MDKATCGGSAKTREDRATGWPPRRPDSPEGKGPPSRARPLDSPLTLEALLPAWTKLTRWREVAHSSRKSQ